MSDAASAVGEPEGMVAGTPIAVPVIAADGHAYSVLACLPTQAPTAALLWLPALGVAAKHYLPFAQALAQRGIAVFLHEWRGNGSSSLRPSRSVDWGYREILEVDLPASLAAMLGPGAPSLAMIGGHSLGGQLATVFAGQRSGVFQQLWLVATGTPYWRTFPRPSAWVLPWVYRFLPWLARVRGVLHGRRVGFGGTEARGLIADWARVGLSNEYRGRGISADLEAGMAALALPIHGVVLHDDWYAPRGSLAGLVAKLPASPAKITTLSATELGTKADHFAWLRTPAAVVDWLLR